MKIYVESQIRGQMDDLWQRTQDPELHERWDLRFSSIKYLSRPDESQPQRFLYTTRIGCGFVIQGTGESVGTQSATDGQRSSSLRFQSDDPKSLVTQGAGYWQYVPGESGIRFITAYNYQTRFGEIGRIVDRLLFGPLMGWATAWSFDRLRLWIEKGIDPVLSMQRSVIHLLCRFTLAFVWIYQGLVPKLLARHADELAMLMDAGIPEAIVPTAVTLIGWSEVLFGIAILVWHRARWPMILTMVLMAFATIGVIANSPRYLAAAFNPVSLNLMVTVFAMISLMVMRDLPSARNCLRTMPGIE